MVNIVGKRFGKLEVIEHTRMGNRYQSFWLCKCDCGQKIEVRIDCLNNSTTKSCGCLSREELRKGRLLRITHGKSGSTEHNIWKSMNYRCKNPKNHAYKNYGGRGITVCDRWKTFKNFYEDMGNRPDGKSLDRINNDGPYSPENCKWSTTKEQCNNYRRNIIITFQNQTHTLTQWSEILGISYSTLRKRIFVYKYPVEKAFIKKTK